MCRLRRALSLRRWGFAAPVALIGLVAPAYLFWRVEESRKGTLTLDCPDGAFAVEVCTDRPPTTWELISGPDARPQWSTWGPPAPEIGSCRCVWFREVERTALDIKLPPGRYVLAAHRKSACGHYGGDTFRTFDVEEGGRVAIAIPH